MYRDLTILSIFTLKQSGAHCYIVGIPSAKATDCKKGERYLCKASCLPSLLWGKTVLQLGNIAEWITSSHVPTSFHCGAVQRILIVMAVLTLNAQGFAIRIKSFRNWFLLKSMSGSVTFGSSLTIVSGSHFVCWPSYAVKDTVRGMPWNWSVFLSSIWHFCTFFWRMLCTCTEACIDFWKPWHVLAHVMVCIGHTKNPEFTEQWAQDCLKVMV